MRALVLASVLVVIGLVLVLMGALLDANVLLIAVGVICASGGLGLFAAALWSSHAARVSVVLDDDGYVLNARHCTESGRWADVERVTRATDRITIYHLDGTRLHLWVRRGAGSDLDVLSADIARRLEANRGYGTL